MLDLGTARGAITLDADGFLSGVGIVTSGVEELGGVGATAGRGLSSLSDHIDNVIDSMGRFSGVARVIDGVARAMGALAITGGVTLIAGGAKAAWDQVRSVQNATTALRAYEKDASKVDAVLSGLLEYARSDMGVLFSRQELFAAAQGLKLYGAETNNLVRYVEIMSRSVGLGLSNWDQLGTVIGRVGSTGRLVGNDFDYLTAAGYQLDESLRNANVTWDQLFNALDAGIPEDALDGIAQNIDGLVIRVQSAVRDIGNAFLGVDPQTSQFIEGSLGEWLVSGLEEAPGVIRSVAGAAADLGSTIAGTLGIISDFIYAYQQLPAPVRTAVEWILKLATAYGALRVASSALGMVSGALGLTGLLGGVRSLTSGLAAATTGATSFGSALSTLVGSINPVGLAVTAVGIGVAALTVIWARQRAEAKATEQALQSMSNAYLDLIIARNEALLSGDTQSAARLDQLRVQVESVRMETEAMQDYAKVQLANNEITIDQYHKMADAYELNASQANSLADSQNKLQAAFLDTRIDGAALATDLDNLYWAFMRQEITLDQYVTGLADISENTSRYALEADAATDSIEDMTRGLDGLTSSQRTFNLEMAQMRIDGDGAMADTLIRLNDLFGDNARASGIATEYLEFFHANVAAGNFALEDYESSIEQLNFLYDQGLISQGMYDRGIIAITMSATEAATATGSWEESLHALGEAAGEVAAAGIDTAREAIEEFNQVVTENREALLSLAGYDDPLSQWNLSGHASDMSLLAMNTQQAATALENTFRVIVGNTNAIASQVDGVHQWAQALTTAEEGLTQLDELLQKNLITQTEHNAAMQAAEQIGLDNQRVQESVLAIQAKQAPLIAEQTSALADYMDQISQLPAQQQLVALGWMDATTAARALEFQTLAVAAATGQMGAGGQAAFESMIVGAVRTQPELAAVLEDMGLISLGTDGTITIHWSGLEEGMSDFDRLSVMFLEFMNLVSDEPITFEMLGLEDPRQKLEDIEDTTIRLNDNPVSIPVGIDESSAEGGSISAGVDAIVTGISNHYANNPIIIPMEVRSAVMASAGQSAGKAARGALDGVAADFTITVSADTSIADDRVGKLAGRIDELSGTDTTATINADVDAANAELDTLQVRLSGFDGLTSTTTLDADATAANAALDILAERLAGYRNAVSVTTLEADPDQANSALDDLADRLAGYRNAVSVTTLEANPAPANRVLDLLGQRLAGYRNAVSVTTLDANSASAHEVIRLLMNRLDEVDGSSARVYIYVTDWASSAISSVSRALNNLDGRSATTYTTQVNSVVNRPASGQGFETASAISPPMPLAAATVEPLMGAMVMPLADADGFSTMASPVVRPSAPPPPSMTGHERQSPQPNVVHHDNSTHTTEYVTLTQSDFQQLLQKSERGNAAYGHLNDPDAHNYGGGI